MTPDENVEVKIEEVAEVPEVTLATDEETVEEKKEEAVVEASLEEETNA